MSPNGFDGMGPVPEKVRAAARRIAELRVRFLHQCQSGMESPLTIREVEELFTAAALQAEWMRELYEAREEALLEGVTVDDLLTTAEVAALAGVKPATIHRYRLRGAVPTPEAVIAGRPLWRLETVDTWLRERRRRQAPR